jgi:hypothetical protein
MWEHARPVGCIVVVTLGIALVGTCRAQEANPDVPCYVFAQGERLTYDVTIATYARHDGADGQDLRSRSAYGGTIDIECLEVQEAGYRMRCAVRVTSIAGEGVKGVDARQLESALRDRPLEFEFTMSRRGVAAIDGEKIDSLAHELPHRGVTLESLWRVLGLCLILLPAQDAAQQAGGWNWEGEVLTGDGGKTNSMSFRYRGEEASGRVVVTAVGLLDSKASAELAGGHVVSAELTCGEWDGGSVPKTYMVWTALLSQRSVRQSADDAE